MPKTLLLADDSVVIQKLVGLSFANEDVEIVTTDNGDDAVIRAREIRPDVVLADVVMPGKSGYEVCEAIKQDPDLGHVPVLLLTGTFEAFDEARAAASGADGQITKPFEAQALVERVTEVMNRPPPATAASHQTPPPIPPSANEYDFFDENVTTLNPADPATSRAIDPGATTIEPAGQDISASMLFGAPGEGATADLEGPAGGLAIGQSTSPEAPRPDDATLVVGHDDLSQPPPLPEEAIDDDLGLDDPISMPPPLPAAPVDLDAALDAAPMDDDATILVGDNNADTARSLDPRLPASGSTQPTEEQTLYGGSFPSGEPQDSDLGAGATIVTNLDDALDPPEETPISPLDLGPAAVAASDLDFDFDVSEQTPVTDIPDPLDEDPFSPLMGGGEGAGDVLSDPVGGVANDSIAAGYDVSSSELLPPDESSDDLGTPGIPSTAPDLDLGIEDDLAPAADDRRVTPPPVPPTTVFDEPVRPYGAQRELPTTEPAQSVTASSEREPADHFAIGTAESSSTPEESISAESSSWVESSFQAEGSSRAEGSSWTEESSPTASSSQAEGYSSPAQGSSLAEGSAAREEISELERSSWEVASAVWSGAAPESAAVSATEDDLEETAPSGSSEAGSISIGDPIRPEGFGGAAPSDPPAASNQTDWESASSEAAATEATVSPIARGSDDSEDSRPVSDLSPMMEQRVQETLEKVAWEAFSDLSESIVKQVMSRVEQIAWEVIPQMAETLVREEIRKMKGEED